MTAPKPPREAGSVTDRTKPIRVVGIDLGTTNSTIAEVRWEPGGAAPKVRCVEVEQPTLEGATAHRPGHDSLISRSMDAVFWPCLTTVILLGGPEGPRRSNPITSSWAMSFADAVFIPEALTLFGSTTSSK